MFPLPAKRTNAQHTVVGSKKHEGTNKFHKTWRQRKTDQAENQDKYSRLALQYGKHVQFTLTPA